MEMELLKSRENKFPSAHLHPIRDIPLRGAHIPSPSFPNCPWSSPYSDEKIFRLLLKISVWGDAYGFYPIFGSSPTGLRKIYDTFLSFVLATMDKLLVETFLKLVIKIFLIPFVTLF